MLVIAELKRLSGCIEALTETVAGYQLTQAATNSRVDTLWRALGAVALIAVSALVAKFTK